MKLLLTLVAIIIFLSACDKRVYCECRKRITENDDWTDAEVAYLEPYSYHPWEKKLYCNDRAKELKKHTQYAEVECKVRD